MKLTSSIILLAIGLSGCSTGHKNYVTVCYDQNKEQVSCTSPQVHSSQTHQAGVAATQAGNAAAQAGNAASMHTIHHTPPPPPPSF